MFKAFLFSMTLLSAFSAVAARGPASRLFRASGQSWFCYQPYEDAITQATAMMKENAAKKCHPYKAVQSAPTQKSGGGCSLVLTAGFQCVAE